MQHNNDNVGMVRRINCADANIAHLNDVHACHAKLRGGELIAYLTMLVAVATEVATTIERVPKGVASDEVKLQYALEHYITRTISEVPTMAVCRESMGPENTELISDEKIWIDGDTVVIRTDLLRPTEDDKSEFCVRLPMTELDRLSRAAGWAEFRITMGERLEYSVGGAYEDDKNVTEALSLLEQKLDDMTE